MHDVPYYVAKRVILDKLHPVTAWREYLGISIDELKKLSSMPVKMLISVEKTNLHLKPDIQRRLCDAMGIKPYALDFRVHINSDFSNQPGSIVTQSITSIASIKK